MINYPIYNKNKWILNFVIKKIYLKIYGERIIFWGGEEFGPLKRNKKRVVLFFNKKSWSPFSTT